MHTKRQTANTNSSFSTPHGFPIPPPAHRQDTDPNLSVWNMHEPFYDLGCLSNGTCASLGLFTIPFVTVRLFRVWKTVSSPPVRGTVSIWFAAGRRQWTGWKGFDGRMWRALSAVVARATPSFIRIRSNCVRGSRKGYAGLYAKNHFCEARDWKFDWAFEPVWLEVACVFMFLNGGVIYFCIRMWFFLLFGRLICDLNAAIFRFGFFKWNFYYNGSGILVQEINTKESYLTYILLNFLIFIKS